jgi:hypothetical protein
MAGAGYYASHRRYSRAHQPAVVLQSLVAQRAELVDGDDLGRQLIRFLA